MKSITTFHILKGIYLKNVSFLRQYVRVRFVERWAGLIGFRLWLAWLGYPCSPFVTTYKTVKRQNDCLFRDNIKIIAYVVLKG